MSLQLLSNGGRHVRLHELVARRAIVTRGLAGVAAAALLLSACGSDTSESSAGSGGSTEDDLGTALLGMSEDEFFARTEQEIQKCMTAKGWEYEMADPGQFADFDMGGEAAEFASQYGYGLLGIEMTDTGAGVGVDPNAAYIESLSPADLEAYLADLYGASSDQTLEKGAGGCYGEASEIVAGPGGTEALDARFEELYELMAADDGVVEATRKWSTCMADAGYAYSTPEDPVEDLAGRLGAIDTSDDAAVDAFRQEEITIAVADQECQTSSVLVEATEAALQRAAEQLGNS